jgi:Ricin-type beta-trefoil lectin domain
MAIAITPAATVTRPQTGPIVSGYRGNTCLDDAGDSNANDTPVVMWRCNGSAQQSWTIESDGTIQINGRCLDVYRYERANNTPVELWTCHGSANQQWQVVTGGHLMNPELVNPYTGKCLDDPRFNTDDGVRVKIYTCNGGVNQQWKLP